jgi:hypothetical protein
MILAKDTVDLEIAYIGGESTTRDTESVVEAMNVL